MDKIDIRDLRVGNWVYYDPNVFIEDEYEPTKDVEIVQLRNGDDIELVNEECYRPIPLTKEILEKNGFIRYGTNYALVEYDFSLSNPSSPSQYHDNYFVLVDRMGVNVKYVHQLQNILRDLGIKKEIII